MEQLPVSWTVFTHDVGCSADLSAVHAWIHVPGRRGRQGCPRRDLHNTDQNCDAKLLTDDSLTESTESIHRYSAVNVRGGSQLRPTCRAKESSNTGATHGGLLDSFATGRVASTWRARWRLFGCSCQVGKRPFRCWCGADERNSRVVPWAETQAGTKVPWVPAGTRRGSFSTAAGSPAMSWAWRINSSLVFVAAR
jgi:hypothetical protein